MGLGEKIVSPLGNLTALLFGVDQVLQNESAHLNQRRSRLDFQFAVSCHRHITFPKNKCSLQCLGVVLQLTVSSLKKLRGQKSGLVEICGD